MAELIWVLPLVLISTLFFILIVIWAVFASDFNHFKSSVSIAINNDQFCEPNTGPCKLNTNDSLTFTVPIPDAYDSSVARYCADLVARVEALFTQTDKGRIPRITTWYGT